MSSTIDPAKLKVVELRAELSKRGLDSKGNKPALVKRLKEALEEEYAEELPDTSIADSSIEDLDSSQSQEVIPEETKPPEKPEVNQENNVFNQSNEKHETENIETVKINDDALETNDEAPKVDEVSNKVDEAPVVIEDTSGAIILDTNTVEEKMEVEDNKPVPEDISVVGDKQETNELDNTSEVEKIENGEQVYKQDQTLIEEEPKSRKSRWGDADGDLLDTKEGENVPQQSETDVAKSDGEGNKVEEKRRRESQSSPERSQRRRSKSPIKEDEPPIDNDKVQLSWYDSDLHLQLDKESFLSAKPYHEGAFGFAWAGVRATHGVTSGKVCYEVKITEELKWEDFSKHYERNRRDSHRSDAKHTKDKNNPDEKSKNDNNEKSDVEDTKSDAKPDPEQPEETENEDTTLVESEEQNIQDTSEEKSGVEEEKKPESNEEMEVDENKEHDVLPTHLFRVGWSLPNTGLQLGENKHSYGYESTGRFVTDKQFRKYGITFGVGDVIATFLCINDDHMTITYSVNGETQSDAITIEKSELPLENCVLFPHVLSRNYAFEFNLGSKEDAWFPKPEHLGDYEYLDKVESKIAGPVRPENRSDCEVILMCGLPASGKTHWVQQYVESNPDKCYTLLGNSQLLEKMTISGDSLKNKYKGRWNILLDKLQKCLNKLIEIAALRRRNYIIDQTNVFPSAQRRKLRPFEGFKRRAVVVVVGDEEQAKRQSLQEVQGGKDVPDSTVLEMKANMSLPQKSDWIDDVLYAVLDEAEAKSQVQKYNNEGREAGYGGAQKRFTHRDDRHRWQNRRNDYRGFNFRDRNYHNNRYDRGPPRQGNWHSNRPGGWNRDRRDNRGPPTGGSRDWRNNRVLVGRDRGNRDNHNQVSNYNRNRNQSRGGTGGGNWQSGSAWGQNQGTWNNQAWTNQGSWGPQGTWNSQQSQNQWKYGGGGGGQGYGGYSNWNYYGQYAQQNWNPQQNQAQSTGGTTTQSSNQYGQYSQQQQAWAQYAQQYVQGQNTSTPTTSSSQSALQK